MHRAKTFDGVTGGIVFRLTRRIHTHMAQARTRQSLGALDDHLLRDIGIARADIDYVVKGTGGHDETGIA